MPNFKSCCYLGILAASWGGVMAHGAVLLPTLTPNTSPNLLDSLHTSLHTPPPVARAIITQPVESVPFQRVTSTPTPNAWASRLPEMTSGEGFISQQQNRQLGEWALRQIYHDAPLIDDPWLQYSLEQLCWQMNASVRREAPLALVVINEPQINAFAVPSGLIGLNVGLLDKARNIDELASVLAHEIAHVSQRHFEQRSDEKNKQLATQVGGLLAGLLAAKVSDGDAGAAVMIGTQTISANQIAAFSRAQEREADRVGMQIMAQSGYDVRAMPSFFALLNQQHPMPTKRLIPSFVMSHPLTAERLSEATDRARAYGAAPTATQQNTANHAARNTLFDQLQWRARYLAKLTNRAELIQAVNNNARNLQNANGARLALVMSYLDTREYAAASRVLAPLQPMIANLSDPLAVMVAASLDERQGDARAALDRLTRLSRLLPERRDVKYALADVYLRQAPSRTNAQAVMDLMLPISRQYPTDLHVWQNLTQASEQLSKLSTGSQQTLYQANTLRYRAQVEYWHNDLTEAVTSLNQAKRLAQSLPSMQAAPVLASINQQTERVQAAHRFKPS